MTPAERRQGVDLAQDRGWAKREIAEAIGTSPQNLSQMLHRGDGRSRFYERLDEWLQDHAFVPSPAPLDGDAYTSIGRMLEPMAEALQNGALSGPVKDAVCRQALSILQALLLSSGCQQSDNTNGDGHAPSEPSEHKATNA